VTVASKLHHRSNGPWAAGHKVVRVAMTSAGRAAPVGRATPVDVMTNQGSSAVWTSGQGDS